MFYDWFGWQPYPEKVDTVPEKVDTIPEIVDDVLKNSVFSILLLIPHLVDLKIPLTLEVPSINYAVYNGINISLARQILQNSDKNIIIFV